MSDVEPDGSPLAYLRDGGLSRSLLVSGQNFCEDSPARSDHTCHSVGLAEQFCFADAEFGFNAGTRLRFFSDEDAGATAGHFEVSTSAVGSLDFELRLRETLESVGTLPQPWRLALEAEAESGVEALRNATARAALSVGASPSPTSTAYAPRVPKIVTNGWAVPKMTEQITKNRY